MPHWMSRYCAKSAKFCHFLLLQKPYSNVAIGHEGTEPHSQKLLAFGWGLSKMAVSPGQFGYPSWVYAPALTGGGFSFSG